MPADVAFVGQGTARLTWRPTAPMLEHRFFSMVGAAWSPLFVPAGKAPSTASETVCHPPNWGITLLQAVDWLPYGAYHGVYVEITKTDHGHGGPGWEYGTCLFSPTRNQAGADRYSIMREPDRGDLVLHFLARQWDDGAYESRLAGRSVVAKGAREVMEEPPLAGKWTGLAPYYRIELEAYEEFAPPLALRTLVNDFGEEIRGDILNAAPRFYPFSRWGAGVNTVQGIYLARVTAGLYGVLRRALGLEEAAVDNEADPESHAEYVESRRMARERYYFARNSGLVTAAKDHHGYVCQVCGFDFCATYGGLGRHYIECHHKSPLSERPEEEQLDGAATGLDDVAVVCSNCHRMLHRRRPALSVEELKAVLQLRA
jgi:hypothetical protein